MTMPSQSALTGRLTTTCAGELRTNYLQELRCCLSHLGSLLQRHASQCSHRRVDSCVVEGEGYSFFVRSARTYHELSESQDSVSSPGRSSPQRNPGFRVAVAAEACLCSPIRDLSARGIGPAAYSASAISFILANARVKVVRRRSMAACFSSSPSCEISHMTV